MCDWPKSDCDVSVTDRQTDKHFGFWAITFESPSHQGARGLRPRAPWCSGNNIIYDCIALVGGALKRDLAKSQSVCLSVTLSRHNRT